MEIDQPAAIARVVYRHGKRFSNGGWFDTSEGKPRIQMKRTRTANWETVATLDNYPDATAAQAPGLRDGEAFSVRLKEPVKAVGVRIAGKPGGSFSSCAELGRLRALTARAGRLRRTGGQDDLIALAGSAKCSAFGRAQKYAWGIPCSAASSAEEALTSETKIPPSLQHLSRALRGIM